MKKAILRWGIIEEGGKLSEIVFDTKREAVVALFPDRKEKVVRVEVRIKRRRK